MRHTGKLVATAAVVGAAVGIFASQQMNKMQPGTRTNTTGSNTGSKAAGNTGAYWEQTTANNYNGDYVETKTASGYTTNTANTSNTANQPSTHVTIDKGDNTSTDMNIDIR